MLKNENFIETLQTFKWYNEPVKYEFRDVLIIHTDADTDYWQRTHYGFRRDNGHFLYGELKNDFAMTTLLEFNPVNQYDQCGLMIRLDSDNWIKVSVEYEDTRLSRLGSVVTKNGYSDWATSDISSDIKSICYRISRRGGDFLIEFSYEGLKWK